ncbi:MAG: phosphoribosylglycinamide formyltransferase [Pseudomonadales bacterium]
MRIAALASHGGSILQAVIDACQQGDLQAEVVLVISNNSGAEALARAHRCGIPTLHLSSATHADDRALDEAMAAALAESGADWVLLAGYMKKLGPRVLAAYRDRIVNTHPALLPKYGGRGYYGRRVHEAVLAAGERESGASVHLVTDEYDAGPVIAQARVPVRSGDRVEDLENRVKDAERALIVATLQRLAAEPALD